MTGLGSPRIVVHHLGPDPATVGGMATVIRILTEHRVGGDVVDCHPTWRPEAPLATARLVTRSGRALLKAPTGEVAHVHLSEGGSFLREGSLLALARRRGLVTVATIHGARFIPFAHAHPRLVSAVLNRANLITCLDRDTLHTAQRGAPSVRCELLPNPVLPDANPSPADSTEELVVFAGEIGLRKGADVLERAWSLVSQHRPQARCVMVGPITDYAPAPTERLEVRPPVGPSEMQDLLRRARVVALPSRAEGLPMVLTEAMGLGRPFVSTPVGAVPELAPHGGTLVPVGDHIALAHRLTELLAQPQLARTVGESGRQFCAHTRGLQVIDARLRELYAAAAGQ
jgi:glycosyltransferase involved in cell wall biosynthesis